VTPRVVPNLITNSKPGDLFITRNIGNFIPPYQEGGQYLATASALEYAVGVLEVEEVIICAHSECGAIGTLFKPIEPTPNNIHIVNWLSLGNEARDKALKSLPKASMKRSLGGLPPGKGFNGLVIPGLKLNPLIGRLNSQFGLTEGKEG